MQEMMEKNPEMKKMMEKMNENPEMMKDKPELWSKVMKMNTSTTKTN